MKCYYEQLAIAQSHNLLLEETKALFNMGSVHFRKNEYDKALKQYEKCREIMLKIGNRRAIGILLNQIGVVYRNQARFKEANENYFKMLHLAEESGDTYLECLASTNIGVVFGARYHFDKASMQYAQKAAENLETSDAYFYCEARLVIARLLYLKDKAEGLQYMHQLLDYIVDIFKDGEIYLYYKMFFDLVVLLYTETGEARFKQYAHLSFEKLCQSGQRKLNDWPFT